MTNHFDTHALFSSLEASLKAELGQILENSTATLDGPIRQAATRLTTAIQLGRQELVQEIADGLAVDVIAQKMRLVGVAQGGLSRVLGFGLNLLFNGAVGALGALQK